MANKISSAVVAFGIFGLIASPTIAASEVQCPPGEGEVDVRVVPQVTYDGTKRIYTYRYTLENLRTSRLSVVNLDLKIPRNKVGNIEAPEGWLGQAEEIGPPGNAIPTIGWLAYKVEHPDRIAEGPEIPKSISALKPGKTVSGFIIKSTLPPGPTTAYVTGQVRIEPVSSEAEMERMYRECETVGQSYVEAARKIRTAGPAEGDFQPIGIDIKPGSADNPVNPNQQGVVPVAILGSSDLAVSQLDPAWTGPLPRILGKA